MLGLFTPDDADLPTLFLRPSSELSARREAWNQVKIAAFRHASALHHARTGRPAIAPADEEAMLEGLLGCYWSGCLRLGANQLPHETCPRQGSTMRLPMSIVTRF